MDIWIYGYMCIWICGHMDMSSASVSLIDAPAAFSVIEARLRYPALLWVVQLCCSMLLYAVHWAGLCCTGLLWAGLEWAGLVFAGPGWAGSGLDWLGWAGPSMASTGWAGLPRISLRMALGC